MTQQTNNDLRWALVECLDRLILFTRALPEHCSKEDYTAIENAERVLYPEDVVRS